MPRRSWPNRHAKDAHFLTAADSLLRGPDARLRRPPASQGPIVLTMSDGQTRIARRVAFLDFALAGQRVTLTGFSLGSTPPGSLFVPFADVTSGRESYGSGRYLAVEIEADGSVVLDINLATTRTVPTPAPTRAR